MAPRPALNDSLLDHQPGSATLIATARERFAERVRRVLGRIDYRLASSDRERDTIYRLRYEAYLREGAIDPNPHRRLTDPFDDSTNVWIFGAYLDGELASSVRIHVASAERPVSPALQTFSDVLSLEIAAGKRVIDSTRFVTDLEATRKCPELPYVTVRLAYMACEFFSADLALAAVRVEHQAFYRRFLMLRPVCPPRPFPTLKKPVGLMAVAFPAAKEAIAARCPFLRSTDTDRNRLFDRALQRVEPGARLRTIANRHLRQGSAGPELRRLAS